MTYLDMLQLWLMPQLENIPTFIFQQDGSPANFHCEVRQYLNTVLPGRWLRLEMTNHWCYGPQGPLTLRPVIFFWAYIKDRVYVPPLPCDFADLKARIIAAVKISMHPCWRVCGKNLNTGSPVMYTSNICSWGGGLFQFSCGCEQFH